MNTSSHPPKTVPDGQDEPIYNPEIQTITTGRRRPFWVVELINPETGFPFPEACYWNGSTGTLFDPFVTRDIRYAAKFDNKASCEAALARLEPSDGSHFEALEHAWG